MDCSTRFSKTLRVTSYATVRRPSQVWERFSSSWRGGTCVTDVAAMRLEARQGRGQIYFRAFVGLLLRDTRVLRRQVFAISARTLINPLLFVFVFTYLFPKIGQEVAAGRGISF